MTFFNDDIKTGTKGEDIFLEDYIIYKELEYEDVRNDPSYQSKDIDFIIGDKTYEIKCNYKDNDYIALEEYTNCNKSLGPISFGWLKKCKADIIVFVSEISRTMIFLNFNNEFKKLYNRLRKDYVEIRNKVTNFQNGNFRQGSFRLIYIGDIEGHYEIYKKQSQEYGKYT